MKDFEHSWISIGKLAVADHLHPGMIRLFSNNGVPHKLWLREGVMTMPAPWDHGRSSPLGLLYYNDDWANAWLKLPMVDVLRRVAL